MSLIIVSVWNSGRNILTGETEMLGENPVSVPLCSLQMSFAMALD
jgi:hypothetical protein